MTCFFHFLFLALTEEQILQVQKMEDSKEGITIRKVVDPKSDMQNCFGFDVSASTVWYILVKFSSLTKVLMGIISFFHFTGG